MYAEELQSNHSRRTSPRTHLGGRRSQRKHRSSCDHLLVRRSCGRSLSRRATTSRPSPTNPTCWPPLRSSISRGGSSAGSPSPSTAAQAVTPPWRSAQASGRRPACRSRWKPSGGVERQGLGLVVDEHAGHVDPEHQPGPSVRAGGPPPGDLPQRLGGQVVQLGAGRPARSDQPGPLQQGQVLRDGLPGRADAVPHGQPATDLEQRLPVPLRQLVQDDPPGRVGQRPEQGVGSGEVGHTTSQ